MPNPWVLLAVVLTWGASLAGVGWWQRQDGAQATEAKWLAVQSAERGNAAAALDKAQRDARAAEEAAAAAAAIDAANYQKEIQDAKDQHDRDVAAARTGAIRLRVAGACPVHPDHSGALAPAASGPGGDGAADAELPSAITERLLGLADDADQVVRQLTACQAIVVQDRK